MGALARAIGDPDGPELLDWLEDYIGALSAKGGAANLSLAYSVGSNALTIAAKQQGGTDATEDQPIIAGMRSATATSGDFNVRSITAALSMTVSSGSTLGQANSDPRWTYAYLIDNAGTLELAVSTKFFGMAGIASTTTEGGAGAADSETAMYSTTARSNVPFLCVGRFKGPQTVAGTWAAVPVSAEASPMFSDDESGSWTPVLTFATPGNLAVTYSVQVGRYIKIGKQVIVRFDIITSAFTHTSASGAVRITGLPFTAATITNDFGSGSGRWAGITKANYTQVAALVSSGNNYVELGASGSAQSISAVSASDMPTGGGVRLSFTVSYEAAT